MRFNLTKKKPIRSTISLEKKNMTWCGHDTIKLIMDFIFYGLSTVYGIPRLKIATLILKKVHYPFIIKICTNVFIINIITTY